LVRQCNGQREKKQSKRAAWKLLKLRWQRLQSAREEELWHLAEKEKRGKRESFVARRISAGQDVGEGMFGGYRKTKT